MLRAGLELVNTIYFQEMLLAIDVNIQIILVNKIFTKGLFTSMVRLHANKLRLKIHFSVQSQRLPGPALAPKFQYLDQKTIRINTTST